MFGILSISNLVRKQALLSSIESDVQRNVIFLSKKLGPKLLNFFTSEFALFVDLFST